MGTRPLWTALERIRRADLARFYMPGHKGRMPEPFTQAAPYDVTEIAGADSLYECTGAIRPLEEESGRKKLYQITAAGQETVERELLRLEELLENGRAVTGKVPAKTDAAPGAGREREGGEP